MEEIKFGMKILKQARLALERQVTESVLTGLVNGKKQTKNRRQLLKIFYIPDFSKLQHK